MPNQMDRDTFISNICIERVEVFLPKPTKKCKTTTQKDENIASSADELVVAKLLLDTINSPMDIKSKHA